LPDKILVADDEPDTRNLVKMILEREGYQVVGASNGEEALQKVDSKMPDLVLLDVVMPEKSGLEACKILKAQAKTKHIPVIMFTVLSRDVDQKLAREFGADGYFIKPFTSEALLEEVKRHLNTARAWKFSKQLGLEHSELKGNKILLEFDPSTPYERFVRDFVLECAFHGEAIHVLTKKPSAVRQALEGDEGIELVDLTPETMLSPILKEHPKGPVSLVYDNLTDLALSVSSQAAYNFTQNALQLLSEPIITALFLLNTAAHEPRHAYSLRGLFSNHVIYGKQGAISVKIA